MPELAVKYQIPEDGDCEECQAEHRQYCMAFKEYHKEQLQSCKDFLAKESSKVYCCNCIHLERDFINNCCNCHSDDEKQHNETQDNNIIMLENPLHGFLDDKCYCLNCKSKELFYELHS